MLGAPLACVHAQIFLKFCLENRKYVGRLYSKFGKDQIRGYGEIGISLTMHVYLQFFFVFSAIFQVQDAKVCLKITAIDLALLKTYYQNVPVSVEK